MDNADILRSAAAAYQAGNPALTEQIARQQLRAGADQESWLLMLGLALQSQSRFSEAVEAYAELTRRYPQSGTHWGNLGTVLRQAGRLEEAEGAYCQAIVLEPANAQHLLHMGLLLNEKGNRSSARVAFLNAVDLDPDNVHARIHGASTCFSCGDHGNAKRLLAERDDWQHVPDLQMDDLVTLSNALLLFGRGVDAEQVLLDALPLADAHEKPFLQAQLVAVYERLNRLEEAHRVAAELPDPASVSDPKLAQEIASVQADLAHRGNDLAGAKVKLEELAEQPETTAQSESSLMFALARVCDKQGDANEAMRALKQAHAAQLRHAVAAGGLMIDPDVDPLHSLLQRLSVEQFARWPADLRHAEDSRPDPIFIVGFPRSGTTLLEQMLDATPGLRSMDERDFVLSTANRLRDAGSAYPDSLGELSKAHCNALRSMYWTSVADVVSLEPDERLVDKNPLNMLLLPMIRRLFPDAPIILALRHPCDVVLSCYMQDFRSLTFVDMCSSLERLARSYVSAMNFWIDHERLLQPNVLHLRYERMLADFDGHVRQIGHFLGLGDAAAMHDFHGHARRKGYIGTPSYSQVIQPLNSAAVGRWRMYEQHFRTVLPILQPIIEHWGYAD